MAAREQAEPVGHGGAAPAEASACAAGDGRALEGEAEPEIELGEVREKPCGAPSPPPVGDVASLGRPGWPGRVRLWSLVLQRVYEHAREYPKVEVAGLLVGGIHVGPAWQTLAWDAIPMSELPSSPLQVTLSHDAWARAMEQVWQRSDGAQVVGWYHSHPGLGVFVSQADAFIIAHFFRRPGQVALVYDNQRRQVGVFALHQGRVVAVSGVELALGPGGRGAPWHHLRYAPVGGWLERLWQWVVFPIRARQTSARQRW
jgi:proteasome lid subunit RPN8/RPN11